MTDAEEITIAVEDGKVTIETAGGAKAKGDFKLNSLDQRVVRIFEDWLRKGKITEDEEMEVLGNILYNAIFNGDVGSLFDKKIQDLDEKKRKKEVPRETRLRLVLEFKDTTAEGFPWEFLYYPKDNTPLAVRTSLVLLRRVSSQTDREILVPPDGSFKVLMIVVQPEEFMEGIGLEVASKYKESFDKIGKAVQDLKDLGIDVIGPLEEPTPEILADYLKQEPHVVHYIGYGKYVQGGQIALMNPDQKKAGWYSKNKFADVFDIEGIPPRLVFLQLCEGPQTDTSNDYYLKANFTDLAPEIIKKRIPAVVAMRYPVQPDVAYKFTQKFYETLAEGKSVATAVQEARWKSTLGRKNRDIGSPVLFMHSYDGLILPLRIAQSDKGSQTSAATRASFGVISSAANQAASESTSPDSSSLEDMSSGIEELTSEILPQTLDRIGSGRPKVGPK